MMHARSTDAPGRPGTRLRRAALAVGGLLSPRTWMQAIRLLHYYGYTHSQQRGRLTLAPGARIAPNVSLTYAERISIGPRSNVGARCTLWAGIAGSITIGADTLIAPGVSLVSTGYDFRAGSPVATQEKVGGAITIGSDVWLGANVVVVGGVAIGDGCIVGANSVVTRSLPPNSIAAGAPARVIGPRFPGEHA